MHRHEGDHTMVEVRNFFSGRTPTRKVATSSAKHTVFPPFGSSILTRRSRMTCIITTTRSHLHGVGRRRVRKPAALDDIIKHFDIVALTGGEPDRLWQYRRAPTANPGCLCRGLRAMWSR